MMPVPSVFSSLYLGAVLRTTEVFIVGLFFARHTDFVGLSVDREGKKCQKIKPGAFPGLYFAQFRLDDP
jgi:hypothetical protein